MVIFAEPIRLWLLAAPALAAFGVVLRHRRRLAQQRRLASPAVWDRLMGGAPATGLPRLISWCAAAILIVLALARPQWGEMPVEESVRTRDLVFAVDVSASMLCPDVRPSRLARSLELVHRVLPAFEGNRVGVVVFAGEAYALVPLTTDLQAVATFLAVVESGMVGRPGSNVQLAVSAGLKLLPEEGEGRVVVLFSDGENLQGDVGVAAESLREAGVGLLAVMAGTEDGGPIPVLAEDGSLHYKRDQEGRPVVTHARRDALEQVAEGVNGEVIDLAERDAARRLIDAVNQIRTREVDITNRVQLIERFPVFLVAAAFMLVLSFALSPWRRRALAAAMLFLLASATAGAQTIAPEATPAAVGSQPTADAEDAVPPPIPWWQRLIPGGSRRMARTGIGAWQDGEFEDAARDFAGAAALDPENGDRLFDLGTALAAGGLVEPALQLLGRADADNVDNAAYNAGTASLQQQQAEAAVTWLRKALLANPDDADAKRNYELALRLLEEQKQEQEQDQDQEEDDDEEKEDEEKNEEQQDEQPTPTSSPSSGEGAEPTPTPTPDPNNPLYAALDQAEAEAREQMRSPTPQAVTVEKDW